MHTLVLEASTYSATVALLRGRDVVLERDVRMRGEREERLLPAVAAVLDEARLAPGDVAQIACGAGPGSFTSLRIAGSIAKGMALATGAPVHAVSSLLLIVPGAPATAAGGRWLATLDAMRGDSYAQAFDIAADGRIVAAGAPALVPTGELAALAAAIHARWIGPGAEIEALPRASGVARVLPQVLAEAPVDIDTWEPEYGRLAEAQVKWEAAHGRRLAPE